MSDVHQAYRPPPAEPDDTAGPRPLHTRPGDGTDSARRGEGPDGSVAVARPAARRLSPGWIVALFTLLMLLPLTLLTYTAISLGSDAVIRQVRAQVQSSAALEARAVVIRMDGITAQADGFAKSSTLLTAFGGSSGRNRNLPALQDEMKQILQSNPGFSSAAVLDTAGRLISIAPPDPSLIGHSFSYRDWYKAVRRTGATYVSSALQSAALGHPLVVAVATPIRVPGTPRGPRRSSDTCRSVISSPPSSSSSPPSSKGRR